MSEIKCPLMDCDVTSFKCGNDSIEQQIKDSYYITLLKQAYGYKILIDGKIVGYYMLYFKEIKLELIGDIMGEDYESNMSQSYIAMHIRYLAIDSRVQRKGIGTTILKIIISDILNLSKRYPIRIITIDALSQYYDWYKKIGFKDIPGQNFNGTIYPMYMECWSEEDSDKFAEYCC